MVCRGQSSFERDVVGGHLGVLAQVIAKCQMPALLFVTLHTQVHVVRAWPIGRFHESRVDEIEVSHRQVVVAELRERWQEPLG